MKWFGVHVIMAVRFKDGKQDSHPAWENVFLVQAVDFDQAEEKAIALGKKNEGDSSGTFTWNDRAAVWVCAGIRKCTEISSSSTATNEPADGAEITYSTLEFKSEDSLRRYCSGEATELTAVE